MTPRSASVPPAARVELAALSIGPVAALAVVTSVFDPYAPNGNLRWGFYVLAALYGIGALFVLRARTLAELIVRAPVYAVFFALTGCAFVYWSEPASRLDGIRAYSLAGHAFTGVCATVIGAVLLLAVAVPVLRNGNRRALDHGEGLVTAYGTLAILVVIPLSQYGYPLANRRYDAIIVSFFLPCVSLVVVLVLRARRLAFWRRAETIEAPEGVPLLFRAFDGNRCIMQSSPMGYREGGMRLPLARVPERVPRTAPLRLSLPAIPLCLALLTFAVPLAGATSFGLPRAVSQYAGGRTEVHPPWFIETPHGWKLWELRMLGERSTLVGIDPHGKFLDGSALFTALAAAGLPDKALGEVALLTLLQERSTYLPNRPPCARPREVAFAHREGDAFVFCSVQGEPTKESSQGLRLRRYRAALSTGAVSEEASAWLPNDGSVDDAAAE